MNASTATNHRCMSVSVQAFQALAVWKKSKLAGKGLEKGQRGRRVGRLAKTWVG